MPAPNRRGRPREMDLSEVVNAPGPDCAYAFPVVATVGGRFRAEPRTRANELTPGHHLVTRHLHPGIENLSNPLGKLARPERFERPTPIFVERERKQNESS